MPVDFVQHAACLARIMKRGSMGQKEAMNLLEAVAEGGEEQRRTGVENPFVTAAWQMARDLKDGAEQRKIDAALNAQIRQIRIAEATQGGIKGAMNTLRGSLFWLAGQDNKENVQTLWRGMSNRWNSYLFSQLQKSGLMEAALDKDMFEPVARELYSIRNGAAPSDTAAGQIAKVVYDLQNTIRARLNAEGARIFDALDWVGHTSHDTYLLERGGRSVAGSKPLDEVSAFQKWWSFVKDRLNPDTFKDITPKSTDPADIAAAREAFGKEVFNSLVSGEHNITRTMEGPKFEAGGFNIARKESQARTLLWKDGTAWAQYMAEYGTHDNWLSLMFESADKGARRAALMNMWGTNPAANLEVAIRRIAQQYKDTPRAAREFKESSQGFIEPEIRQVMKLLDGSMDRPASQQAAQIMRTAREFANMGLLGGVGLTHAASLLTTISSDAIMHGENVWGTLGKAMAEQLQSLKGKDRIDFLEQLGAFGDTLARHTMDHFQYGKSFPGYVSAFHDKFMTATGLSYIFDHAKAGRKAILSNQYARDINLGFDELRSHEQKLLSSYNIQSEDWALLKTGRMTDGNGRPYLTPDVAQTIDRSGVEKLLRDRGLITDKTSAVNADKAITRYQTTLGDRLTQLYQDAADLSVVTPGVRERAMMMRGTTPGTWASEILQAAGMYHAWPIAAMHQILARQFYENSTGAFAWNMGKLVGLGVLGGYLRATVRDLANGEPPREPRNVGEAAKLGGYWLSQGGALGVLGDWVFGEAARSPSVMGVAGGALGAAGPVGGMAGHLLEGFTHWEQSLGTDKNVNLWSEIGKPATGMVPFANLLYLKGAVNYLGYFHMFEAMHPGWWERTNRQMQQDQGRVHFGYGTWYRP